jgi:hypothetical protein
MEHLIGKKVIAFKFSGDPGFNLDMEKLIGQEGIILSCHNHSNICRVEYKNKEVWVYPYPEILNHLVDERNIDDILIEMKQLTSQLWKTKI